MNKLNLYIIILLFLLLYLSYRSEYFSHYMGSYFYPKLKYCSSCGDLDRFQCSDCHNCGYCYPGRGVAGCVPGDQYGPLFREDCFRYEYNYPNYYNPIHYIDSIYKYPKFKYYHDYYNNQDIDKLKIKINKLQKKIYKIEEKNKKA
jgi:hypothetical protein